MILLDTNALDSDRSAFVALDEVQCRTLSLFAGIDMVEHYGELLRLRSCMDGFGIKDMLRKDYKQWSAVESSQQSCIEEKDNAESFKTLQYGLSSIISSYESCQDISENGTAHLDAMRSFAADLRLEARNALSFCFAGVSLCCISLFQQQRALSNICRWLCLGFGHHVFGSRRVWSASPTASACP